MISPGYDLMVAGIRIMLTVQVKVIFVKYVQHF